MNISIASKNFNPSEKLQAAIEKKMSKLDKYFSGDVRAQVMCSEVKTGLCKLEATIYAAGMIFRAEESGSDSFYCLDRIIDKLASQMSRFKTKLIRRHKEGMDIVFDEIPEPAQEAQEGIAKTKRFILNPMTDEEAILQMEMLEHSFFIFKNADAGDVRVVYKREDGSYGLLIPEV